MRSRVLNLFLTLFFSLLFFSADFFLKRYIQANFLLNKPYPLIGKVVVLRLVYNQGAAFGILQGKTFFLIFTGIIFLIFFLVWIARAKLSWKELGFLGMILGGALSNLYDRIFLGAVVDYIDLRFWPIFNLSDTFITLGCLFLLIGYFKQAKCKKRVLE